jgi:hypothetical protein
VTMQLTTQQGYSVLARHGCYVTEVCDKCGRILASVRYTHAGDSRVWCSRVCRDGEEAHAPGTCKTCRASLVGLRRGALFCSDTCRKRNAKQKVLTGANYRGIAAHSKGLKKADRGFGYGRTLGPENGTIADPQRRFSQR